jgi:hypothetical protein
MSRADDLIPLAIAAERLGLDYPAQAREVYPALNIVYVQDGRDPALHKPFVRVDDLNRLLKETSS